MTADDMVIVDLDGKFVESVLHPSSDTPTNLELYKEFPQIGGLSIPIADALQVLRKPAGQSNRQARPMLTISLVQSRARGF